MEITNWIDSSTKSYIIENNFQLGDILLNIPLNILDINNVSKFKCYYIKIVKNMFWLMGDSWNIIHIKNFLVGT